MRDLVEDLALVHRAVARDTEDGSEVVRVTDVVASSGATPEETEAGLQVSLAQFVPQDVQ